MITQEVGYLLQIANIKVLAMKEQIELIKQNKFEVTILFSEQASQNIDGGKLFMLGNSFGRMIGLGMEGSQLKIVMKTNGLETSKWLTIAENLLKGLPDVKRSHKCLILDKKCNSTCIEELMCKILCLTVGDFYMNR